MSRSHGPCFRDHCPCYALSPIVVPQRIAVSGGFVSWFEHFEELSVNTRTSNDTSWRTETSVRFLQDIGYCVCVLGTVRLVEFRQAINPQVRNGSQKNWPCEQGLRSIQASFNPIKLKYFLNMYDVPID